VGEEGKGPGKKKNGKVTLHKHQQQNAGTGGSCSKPTSSKKNFQKSESQGNKKESRAKHLSPPTQLAVKLGPKTLREPGELKTNVRGILCWATPKHFRQVYGERESNRKGGGMVTKNA